MVPLEFMDEWCKDPTLSEGFIAATSKKRNTKIIIMSRGNGKSSLFMDEFLKYIEENA